MLAAIRKRNDREDEGFTLIELMVVVLIIAILLAIAIPTFLSAQDRARDRGAQSDLRNSLTAAKTIATDHEGFFRGPTSTDTVPVALTHSDMNDAETAIVHGATASDTVVDVYVDSTNAVGEGILLVKHSKSKASFGLRATSDGTVTYCKIGKEDALADRMQADATAYTACDDLKW